MRRKLMLGLGLVMAGALFGCENEGPVTLGQDILTSDVHTYDVVLDAAEFLQSDTTYDGLGEVQSAPFAIVARSFGGELEANAIFRVRLPERLTYEDADGVSVTDTAFEVVGGTLTLLIDSLGVEEGPADLELFALTESWDAGSVTWELRSDTGGVAEPWTEPGGTRGELLGTETWEGGDTVRIHLDSAQASVWNDSAATTHGGLIRSTTENVRFRIQSVSFEFDVRPESTDTILAAGSAQRASFVVTPDPSDPEGGELRVGGVPVWRSALHFRRLGNVEIPCGPDPTTCRIPLSDVDVNMAVLLLEPLTVGPRRIERPMRVEGRGVLRAPGVAVSRSPLTNPFGVMPESLAPDRFADPSGDSTMAQLPLTPYVRTNLGRADDDDTVLWVALLAVSERSAPVFGYASFGSMQSTAPPRLRLVVTGRVEGQP